MKVNNHKTLDVYEKIVEWWKGNSFPPLSVDFLPDECFIVSDNNIELYCMFFYHTNSNLCWVGFPVVNHKTTKDQRKNGLTVLIEGIIEYSKQQGYKFIFTTSPIRPVQEALGKNGFILGDEQVNHYIKNI